jgi:formylglycine-generating enzyme required for sulfatase activity
MARVKGGSYTPLYKEQGAVNEIDVELFYLDKYQVTNQQFIEFTQDYDKWSKAKIKPIFADPTYLQQFEQASVKEIAKQPVVNVSWFAATAYCKAQGKRLPSLDEWEYTARASTTQVDGTSSAEFRELILQWYSKPVTEALNDVTLAEANYWGVHGMHGIVWELVRDFNTALVTGESRGDASLDKQLFCGAGAASSIDPSDYAAFMRYALRSSYSSSYTLNSLGFRCAKSINPKVPPKL